MVQKPYLLTQDGLERLTAELHQLRTDGRERLAERLHQALEDGQDDDFIDNAELEAARHEQSFLEGRIQELETILSNYEIIGKGKGVTDKNKVGIGARVTVSEVGIDEDETYYIVGPAEADPVEGRISNESPLGRVLLGQKVGDTVSVEAPNGTIEFTIVKIAY